MLCRVAYTQDIGGGTRPGSPRAPTPDSATKSTAAAAIGVHPRNSRRTAQHDSRQVESDTDGEAAGRTLNFAIVYLG